MNELVSVIVPVYNAGRVLKETISSVLRQSYRPLELLLVNDASADDSYDAAAPFLASADDAARIRWIENTGKHGACHARNLGTENASGRYICFLDADDLWDPEKLTKQTAFMERTHAAFSFTGYEFADENGKGLKKFVRVPDTLAYEEALKNTTIFTSTVMFDMTLLNKQEIRMPQIESEDTATWWRILKSGVTAYGLDESLTLYRRSRGTLSSDKRTAVRRIWRLYREAEGLSVLKSAYCFVFWAVRAVLRRL